MNVRRSTARAVRALVPSVRDLPWAALAHANEQNVVDLLTLSRAEERVAPVLIARERARRIRRHPAGRLWAPLMAGPFRDRSRRDIARALDLALVEAQAMYRDRAQRMGAQP